MYLPYRAGAGECYNGIELYIASLNMLHSRLFKKTTTTAATLEDLGWPVDLRSLL